MDMRQHSGEASPESGGPEPATQQPNSANDSSMGCRNGEGAEAAFEAMVRDRVRAAAQQCIVDVLL